MGDLPGDWSPWNAVSFPNQEARDQFLHSVVTIEDIGLEVRPVLSDGRTALVRWRPAHFLRLNDIAYAHGGRIPDKMVSLESVKAKILKVAAEKKVPIWLLPPVSERNRKVRIGESVLDEHGLEDALLQLKLDGQLASTNIETTTGRSYHLTDKGRRAAGAD